MNLVKLNIFVPFLQLSLFFREPIRQQIVFDIIIWIPEYKNDPSSIIGQIELNMLKLLLTKKAHPVHKRPTQIHSLSASV